MKFIFFLLTLLLLGCDTNWNKPIDIAQHYSQKREDSTREALKKHIKDSADIAINAAREAHLLKAIHESALNKITHEMYRVNWWVALRANPLENMIKIETNDSGKYFITTKWFYRKNQNGGFGVYDSIRLYDDTLIREFRHEITPDSWFDFKFLIEASYFWSRPEKAPNCCTDGWGLTIEGTEYNKDSNKIVSHKVIRDNPQSESIIAIHKKLMELSGVFFINKDGRWEERKPEDYRKYNY